MDSSWTHPTLHHLKATSFPQNYIRRWHTNILEVEMHVTMRRIIVAHNMHGPLDGDTWSVCWYKDDGLLLVFLRVVGVGLAHHDVQLTGWIAGAANPPFLSNRVSAFSTVVQSESECTWPFRT